MTTTSYAVLGLLAIRPWTTYELAKQMEMSLRNFWPRAERKLYEEPKKLVEYGFAAVTREVVGRRPRSVYEITASGRAELRTWLSEPGTLVSMEFEALIKVFFAEHGTKEQLVTTLERIRDGASERVRIDAQWAEHYLTTGGRFPDRIGPTSLVGKLQADLNHTIREWAQWALCTVDEWPDEIRNAGAAIGALDDVRRRADALPPATDPAVPADRVPPPGSPRGN